MLEEQDIYNKQDVYKEKIAPIVKELKILCSIEKLPMFVTVAVANNNEETVYESDMVYAATDIRLYDKKIGKLLLLINDFDVEPPLHIQACVRDLRDYLDRLQVAKKKAETLDTTLKDNKIQNMNAVINGGDKTTLPQADIDKVMDEDSYRGMYKELDGDAEKDMYADFDDNFFD